MKGRLLLGMLLMSMVALGLYFSLLKRHPELISGYVAITTMFLTKIWNSAEDILAALFQIGESPKPKAVIPPFKPIPSAPGASTVAAALPVLVICLLLIPSLSWARTINNTVINTTTVNPTAIVVTEKNVFGPEFDAPNLVRITENWYLGVEGGKDEAYTNTSRGWFGYMKISYTGTLLDFSHEKQEVANE